MQKGLAYERKQWAGLIMCIQSEPRAGPRWEKQVGVLVS